MKNGHLIKSEKLTRSAKWRQIPDETTRWVYCILIGAVDSWGMMPADECTLKAVLAPLTEHSGALLTRSVQSLERSGLLRTWAHQGALWLLLEDHDKNQRLDKRKRDPEVPIPDKSAPLRSSPERPTDFDSDSDSDLDEDLDSGRQFQTTPPPNPPDPEDTKHPELPNDAEQQFLEIREYADAIWKRETRGLPRHDETFWRVLEALKEYGLDGCKQIVRGHHQQTEKKQFSGIRFAFPAVKGHPAQLDMDWIATYHGAGRKDAKPPQAPNMQSPEPSELSAQMEAEAIAEHEKYCKENGVDPKDAGAIRKLARRAEKTRRSGSGPSKAFK